MKALYIASQSIRHSALAKACRQRCTAPNDLGANTSLRRRRDLQSSASQLSNPWKNGELAVRLPEAQQGMSCRQITPRICKPSAPRDAHPDFAMLQLHLAIVSCVIKAEQYCYQAMTPSMCGTYTLYKYCTLRLPLDKRKVA